VIKYIGSKRRLVPVLARICESSGARTALDLFTGTTRVAQAFKTLGVHVTAQPGTQIGTQVAASDAGASFIPLGIGKSVVIDLPGDVKDVLVADPKIANAVVRSARRAYLIGVAVGQTSVFFFDAQGHQLAGFDIAVTRDLNGVRAALRQMFPNSDLRIEGVGDVFSFGGQDYSLRVWLEPDKLASRNLSAGDVVLPFRHQSFQSGAKLLHVFYCLWSDRRAPDQPASSKSGPWNKRWQAVFAGERNLGQQVLEIVLQGPESSDEAVATLERELPNLVRRQ